MSVNNSIVKKDAKASQITEYVSNGETVRISPGMIKKYLVSGGGQVTDEEVVMFLSLCKFQHLNPFLREAYLIKYGDRQPATMVVGKDVFLKRAKKQSEFVGLQGGVIIKVNDSGDIIDREGTFYEKDSETLVGGWAKVYIKGYQVPFYTSVNLDEYIGKKKDGEVNSQWSGKPATMIRKVAISQALKEAFPDQNAGLYVQEEMASVSGVELDEAVIIPAEEAESVQDQKPEVREEVKPLADDVAGALFG